MKKVNVREAIKMKKKGLSLRSIGYKYKTTREGVRQAIQRHEHRMSLSNFNRSLPMRLANKLDKKGIHSAEDVRDRWDEILKIRGVGDKYLELLNERK